MAIEIEVKAWLADAAAVRARLDAPRSGFTFVKDTVKDDAYFAPPDVTLANVSLERDKLVRIRRGKSGDGAETVELTAKVRLVQDGVERNREIETKVDDGAALEAILAYIGFVPLIRKTKRARVYRRGKVTVEVNEVVDLGAFLECERVLEDGAGAEAEKRARGEVKEALDAAGVGAEQVEPRRYIDLLRERLARLGSSETKSTARVPILPELRARATTNKKKK